MYQQNRPETPIQPFPFVPDGVQPPCPPPIVPIALGAPIYDFSEPYTILSQLESIWLHFKQHENGGNITKTINAFTKNNPTEPLCTRHLFSIKEQFIDEYTPIVLRNSRFDIYPTDNNIIQPKPLFTITQPAKSSGYFACDSFQQVSVTKNAGIYTGPVGFVDIHFTYCNAHLDIFRHAESSSLFTIEPKGSFSFACCGFSLGAPGFNIIDRRTKVIVGILGLEYSGPNGENGTLTTFSQELPPDLKLLIIAAAIEVGQYYVNSK